MAQEMHESIKKFFDILEFLKSDGVSETWTDSEGTLHEIELSEKFQQLSLSEKTKVITFFESIIDQPAFDSNDHKRIRAFMVDWYSTNRSIVTQSQISTNPYNLADDELDELIKSFGFPYPDRIQSTDSKAAFVLEIVNIYKKKGTPAALVKSLQTYFNLSNVALTEWWVHRKDTGEFVFKSKPVYPREFRDNPNLIQEIDYATFTSTDPLWKLTYEELEASYEDESVKLPSLTSFLSLQSIIDITPNASLSILSKKMQESYQYWLTYGTLNRDISLSDIEGTYGTLEVVLAINYLFEGQTDSNDESIKYYSGDYAPLDQSVPPDDISDSDYGLILDEYNNLSIRPTTRTERDLYLETRNSKFLGANDGTTNSFLTLLPNPGQSLETINPEFKTLIDDYIGGSDEQRIKLLERIMSDFDYYLNQIEGYFSYPISYLTLGWSTIRERIDDVVEFFKPYRVRIREFLTGFKIDDPLSDSQLEEDDMTMSISQLVVDKGNYWQESEYPEGSYEFDQSVVKDSVEIEIVDL
ncbi:MAG: hypothetical protein KAS32_20890 [Candidatus Peribacteraceae bacterium]|nr:hypothetical protein [Candidatus Peribacteraceae bacterium]